MKKVAFILWAISPILTQAQFFSGTYQSTPSMESFDHFKIKHKHGDEGKYEGHFDVHAFVGHDEIFQQTAETIHGSLADQIIKDYGEGKNILSVHEMKVFLDGVEWEVFLLGYLDQHKHGQFIIVEEVFEDESETELIEIKKYHWTKAHHLVSK